LEPERLVDGVFVISAKADFFADKGVVITPYSGTRKGPEYPEARKILEAEQATAMSLGQDRPNVHVGGSNKRTHRPGAPLEQSPPRTTPPSKRGLTATAAKGKTGLEMFAFSFSPEASTVEIFRLNERGKVPLFARPVYSRTIFSDTPPRFVPLAEGRYRIVVTPYQNRARPLNAHITPRF
jgi:hypothetical protein